MFCYAWLLCGAAVLCLLVGVSLCVPLPLFLFLSVLCASVLFDFVSEISGGFCGTWCESGWWVFILVFPLILLYFGVFWVAATFSVFCVGCIYLVARACCLDFVCLLWIVFGRMWLMSWCSCFVRLLALSLRSMSVFICVVWICWIYCSFCLMLFRYGVYLSCPMLLLLLLFGGVYCWCCC